MKKNTNITNLRFALILSIALSATGCASKSKPAQIDDRQHMIFGRNGPMELVRIYPSDTIESIAKKHNVPVEMIAAANHLSYPYHIYDTRSLLVPKHRYHKTKHGDTLRGIAREYSADIMQLMDANGMMHIPVTQQIKPGTMLIIPDRIENISQHVERGNKTNYQPTKNYDVIELEEVDDVIENTQATDKQFDAENKNNKAVETTQHKKITNDAQQVDLDNDLRKTLGDGNNDAVIDELESDTTGALFAVSTPLNLPQFIWPLNGTISRDEKHEGITIFAQLNTTVRAAGSGKVIFAENDKGEYGNLIIIKHSNNYLTAYAHNNQLLVKKGDEVNKGQAIAKVGKSGKATKPQLYFSMRKGKEIVDPESEQH